MKPFDSSSVQSNIAKGQMQAFIVNRLSQNQEKSNSPGKNQKVSKKNLTQQELAAMNEEEKKRYENQNQGDSLEEKIDTFFSQY